MLDLLNLCSFNVNGLAEDNKRRKIFGLLKHYKVDIVMLQETHCTDVKAKLWQAEWGGQIYCSNANPCLEE